MGIFYLNFRTTRLEFFLSDPLELQKLFGGGDRRYYLEAGLDLAAYNKIRQEYYWIYQLWPPGMSILNGLIFKVTQSNNLITFAHSVIASSLLSYFFINVYRFAQIIQIKIGTLVFIVAFYAQSFSRDWFFTDLMFYADSIGTLLVLTAFCKILIYLNSNRVFLKSLEEGFSIGTILCAAALMRSPYIIILQLITYTCLFVIVFESVRLFSLGIQKSRNRKHQLSNLILVSTIVIVSTLFSNMWLDFREKNMAIGNSDWTATQSTSIISPWVPQNQMAGFIREGGAGWACKIDNIKCTEFSVRENVNKESYSGQNVAIEEYQLETMKVILNNPIAYLQDRIQMFKKVWRAEAGLDIKMRESAYVSNILFALLFIFVSYILLQVKTDYAYIIILVIVFSLIAPYLIFHIEVRYFFVLKLMSLFGIFPLLKTFRKYSHRSIQKYDNYNL